MVTGCSVNHLFSLLCVQFYKDVLTLGELAKLGEWWGVVWDVLGTECVVSECECDSVLCQNVSVTVCVVSECECDSVLCQNV